MSDDTKEVAGDVSDTELTKEQKLEIAKKKFADLKKKNKKKKKKEDKEETPEVEKVEGEADEKVEEELGEKEEVKMKEKEVEVEHEVEVEKETKDEQEKNEQKTIDEDKSNKPEVEQETKPDVSPPDVSPDHEAKSKYSPKVSAKPEETPASIEELTKQVNLQEKIIIKLRDENTDLKLLKMDLQDRITELEQEVQQLKVNGGGSGHQSQQIPGGFDSTPIQPVSVQKLPPVKPVYTRNNYASESKQDLSNLDTRGDFRESLMLWKNWQVDMTLWNGSSVTKQVQL